MKKASGPAPQNSGDNLATVTLKLQVRNNHPFHLCTYSVPSDESAQEPVLMTAYPHAGKAGDAFEAILRQIRQAGWDHIDTDNWNTMTVYPDAIAQSEHQAKPSISVQLRKLSASQRAHAADGFGLQVPENLPVLQVRLADQRGRWPSDTGYDEVINLNESFMETVLGRPA